jgi:hypothetical protein
LARIEVVRQLLARLSLSLSLRLGLIRHAQ